MFIGLSNAVTRLKDATLSFLIAGGKTAGLGIDPVNERYFVDRVSKSFSDAITHTRASTATYTDADGVLQTAEVNEPRIGNHVWDGSQWVNKGVLHESEARTNLIAYSDFSADWATTGTTLTANSETGLDGQLSAASFVESGTSGQHKLQSSVTVSTGATYCQSIVVKSNGRPFFSLYPQLGTNAAADFNLDSVSSSDGGATTNLVGHGIKEISSGKYLCWIVFETTGTTVLPHLYLRDSSDSGSAPSYTGDGTSGVIIEAAQLEAGSTPSIYIPTSGSQVTRAADIMTVPAANMPWPEPVVIGEELVTNGTFDSDSDWTKGTGWTISGGQASFATTGAGANLGQVIATEVGKVYEISCDLLSTDTPLNYFYVSAILPSQVSPELGSALGKKSFVFVAISTTTTVGLRGSSLSTATFDNVSVKEINPLAVSIQMDGTMTYADEDATAEVVPFLWQLDGDNRIEVNLDTRSTRTGEVEFIQEALSVTDVVSTGSPGDYSPGINVPFNIASRHGSTFINGAVDGIALTEDTTPTALPDLSTTDFQIAPTFMGNISKLRVWADDIGDDGIEEASS